MLAGLTEIKDFAANGGIKTYQSFRENAGAELNQKMGEVCTSLQNELKVAGDWQIYPFAVHELIAPGRVQIAGGAVYVDSGELPAYGYRLEELQ